MQLTEAELKTAITQSLVILGVQTAGHFDDGLRWSRTDLVTDLTPVLMERIRALEIKKEGRT